MCLHLLPKTFLKFNWIENSISPDSFEPKIYNFVS